SEPAEMQSTACGASNVAISLSLPALCVAITSFPPPSFLLMSRLSPDMSLSAPSLAGGGGPSTGCGRIESRSPSDRFALRCENALTADAGEPKETKQALL